MIPEVIIWTASEALPVRPRSQPRPNIPRVLPEHGILFVCQCEKFIYSRICRRVISAVNVDGKECSECKHQGGGVADLARILERLVMSASAASG